MELYLKTPSRYWYNLAVTFTCKGLTQHFHNIFEMGFNQFKPCFRCNKAKTKEPQNLGLRLNTPPTFMEMSGKKLLFFMTSLTDCRHCLWQMEEICIYLLYLVSIPKANLQLSKHSFIFRSYVWKKNIYLDTFTAHLYSLWSNIFIHRLYNIERGFFRHNCGSSHILHFNCWGLSRSPSNIFKCLIK